MRYKLFLLDNDGYLTKFGSRTLTQGVPETLAMVHEFSEFGFAVVTGRSRNYVESEHEKTAPRAIASEHGMLIDFADGGRIIYPKNLDYVKRFKESIENNKKGEWFPYVGSDGMEKSVPFVEEPGKSAIYTMSLDPLRVEALKDADSSSIRTMARDLYDYIKSEINSNGYRGSIFPVLNDDSVEIVPRVGAKAWSMKKICEAYRIPLVNTFAGGDSSSDVPMMKEAGLCGTVANASEDVKNTVGEMGGLVSDKQHGHGFRDNMKKIFGAEI